MHTQWGQNATLQGMQYSKEFAKEKSILWAPVVVHIVYPQIVKTPDFCVFLHFLVPKNPTQGSKFSRKKKFFFLRFFDFLTRRWPIQNALVVQKMTGELTLDAQNSPILAFFDFLVPEGDLGCSEQASKTLVKKNFDVFLRFKNRLVFLVKTTKFRVRKTAF